MESTISFTDDGKEPKEIICTVKCPSCDKEYTITVEDPNEIPSDGFVVCNECGVDRREFYQAEL